MASCRDKNDERASACPPLNGRRGIEQRDHGEAERSGAASRADSASSFGRSAGNSCNSAATGDIGARIVCRWVRRAHACMHITRECSSTDPGMHGRVEHLSCGTERHRIDALYRVRKTTTARRGRGDRGKARRDEREIIYD